MDEQRTDRRTAIEGRPSNTMPLSPIAGGGGTKHYTQKPTV